MEAAAAVEEAFLAEVIVTQLLLPKMFEYLMPAIAIGRIGSHAGALANESRTIGNRNLEQVVLGRVTAVAATSPDREEEQQQHHLHLGPTHRTV